MRPPYYHSYVENPLALANAGGARLCQPWPWEYVNSRRPTAPMLPPTGYREQQWPDGAAMRAALPSPRWDGHDDAIACWWKAWELCARHRRRATAANRFASDFVSTAFNGNTFMWDSAFIALFGRYGRRAWPVQGTCDNFYAKQHPDGFICREIGEDDGEDRYQRFDPCATGPNVLGWAEAAHFMATGDRARLARVFPPLLAFSQWMARYRTWPDGSYWATGWSSGMDNQPRFAGAFDDPAPHDWEGFHSWYDHGHATWLDATLQAILAGRQLRSMAVCLGRQADAEVLAGEADRLASWVNRNLWNDSTGFYHDRDRHGHLSPIKSVGAYWALLAGVVPAERLPRFLAHLDDPAAFNRTHRVPSLSADSPGYDPGGGYWRGGVWAPTSYMVLEGLHAVGAGALAHDIARNHLDNVVAAFNATGTLWENYAPDSRGTPGSGHSTPDFVGWTGLVPIAVLLEHVFGLRADAATGRLVWDVRLTDGFAIERYPFGTGTSLNLTCAARRDPGEEPKVAIASDQPVEVDLRWAGGRRTIRAG
jgi:hypothetical protein